MARPDVKTQATAQMLRKRILHGDHALRGFPGERFLSEELGVSRRTVQRALAVLEKEGALVRRENGRLEISAHPTVAAKPTVGMARGSYGSPEKEIWTEGVRLAAEDRDVTLRVMTFDHYAAPHIMTAVSGLDALFFLPPIETIPTVLTDRMRTAKCRVVVLDQDASARGLPSLVMFPPQAERKLLAHLLELGHQRIDCLNTQVRDPIIEDRIAGWQSFLDESHLVGSLFSLTEFHPLESAYQLMRNKLRTGGSLGTAIFCTTAPAAVGAMRACHEAGLIVGRDVSVCAVNDKGLGPYLIPSLTCLQSVPRAPYLRRALDWMLSDEEWQGPLLVSPDDVPMFQGESTGPAPTVPPLTKAYVRE